MATKQRYRVLITTSGVGTPLGEMMNFTNKSLVKVGKKPTLSYILESYPRNTQFVITIGHFGDQVRDFIKLVHADLDITLVPVKKYAGEGSSLGYSMLQAAKYLQAPFIYHASDTLVEGRIPYPVHNWIGGYKGEGSSHYASFSVLDSNVQAMHTKGQLNPDFLHIGLVGIHDYELFWQELKRMYRQQPDNQALSDVDVLTKLAQDNVAIKPQEFTTWYDVGNVDTLKKVQQEIPDSFHILDKVNESIFIYPKSVVKFFHDAKMVKDRVARVKHLQGLVPPLLGVTKNFYKYGYVAGDLYADVAGLVNFPGFLQWAKKNLWRPVREVSETKFAEICRNFYETKTRERVQQFLTTRSIKATPTIINGEKVPAVWDLLRQVDWAWLAQGEQTLFHGDFILDNIIKTKKGYCLLDWRQNFGGLLKAGDRYYDLAKLNHNLTVNHRMVNNNLFTVRVKGQEVTCDILRPQRLVECQEVLFGFLKNEGYDVHKVRILTAIIWLNMAPLHQHPLDLWLYYFGQLSLKKALDEKNAA